MILLSPVYHKHSNESTMIKLSQNYIVEDSDINRVLIISCRENIKQFVLSSISKGANDWNRGLIASCYGGHKEMTKLMISKGVDRWGMNAGFPFACRSGNKEIVKLLIEKGIDNLNLGLFNAYKRNHREIILLIIEAGIDFDKFVEDEKVNIFITLTDLELDYLIKKNACNKMTVFHEKRDQIKSVHIKLQNILIEKLPYDLGMLCTKY